jgi:hypothetical protein
MAGETRPAVTRLQTTDSAILKTGEFGYPSGHLGHLTQQQEEALEAFRKLCQENGLYKPATDIDQNSHDDTTLLYNTRRNPHVDSANCRKAGSFELDDSIPKLLSSSLAILKNGAKKIRSESFMKI